MISVCDRHARRLREHCTAQDLRMLECSRYEERRGKLRSTRQHKYSTCLRCRCVATPDNNNNNRHCRTWRQQANQHIKHVRTACEWRARRQACRRRRLRKRGAAKTAERDSDARTNRGRAKRKRERLLITEPNVLDQFDDQKETCKV